MAFPKNKLHFPTRAVLRHGLRMALATAITAVLTRLLHLQQGYWAVFSAVLITGSDFGSSIAAGWARILGTGAGAAFGALCVAAAAALFGQGTIALAAAIFVSTFFCALLAARNGNFRLAGLTSAIVICMFIEGYGTVLGIAGNRFLETCLGIVVALVVCLAWPSRARVLLRFGLSKGFERLATLLGELMESRKTLEYDRPALFHAKDAVLRLELRNRQLLVSARREPGSKGRVEDLAILLRAQNRLAEHLRGMDRALAAEADGRRSAHSAVGPDSDVRMSAEFGALGDALAGLLREFAVGLRGEPLSAACGERLDAAESSAAARFAALRRERIFSGCDADEVIRIYAFYHSLREAVREARFLRERLAPPPSAAPARS